MPLLKRKVKCWVLISFLLSGMKYIMESVTIKIANITRTLLFFFICSDVSSYSREPLTRKFMIIEFVVVEYLQTQKGFNIAANWERTIFQIENLNEPTELRKQYIHL